MESDRWEQIERLYHAALELGPDARGAFLDEACAGDEELRREVASLLNCDGPDNFIDAPVLGLADHLQAEEQVTEMFDSQPPTRIGLSKLKPGSSTVTSVFIDDYRILRKLGEGGMGVVYE